MPSSVDTSTSITNTISSSTAAAAAAAAANDDDAVEAAEPLPPLYTTTPLDSESIPEYYTVRVPVVAPDSMTSSSSSIITTLSEASSSSSSSSTTTTTVVATTSTPDTEIGGGAHHDVLIVERRRKNQLKMQQKNNPARLLAWHVIACLLVCIVTVLVNVHLVSNAGNGNTTYYGNIEILLLLLVLLPLNAFALFYIYIVLVTTATLFCRLSNHIHNQTTSTLRITVDKQAGKLTMGQTHSYPSYYSVQQEQEYYEPMPGFIDITTIHSIRCQRRLLCSRQTKKNYITYNILYTDNHGIERIMFRGWSQLHEVLFLQQEIENFLSLSTRTSSSTTTTTTTTVVSSNNNNMMLLCCDRNNSDNKKRNNKHEEEEVATVSIASMRRSSSSSSSSSFFLPSCSTSCGSAQQSNKKNSSSSSSSSSSNIIRPAYLKVHRHISTAPDNMVVSCMQLTVDEQNDDNSPDEENNSYTTGHGEVLVVELKGTNQTTTTTTTTRFSCWAWWRRILALFVFTMFLVWMCLTVFVGLSFLSSILEQQPVLTTALYVLLVVVVLLFFSYSTVTAVYCGRTKSSSTTTVTVNKARGTIEVITVDETDRSDNDMRNSSRFPAFFSLRRTSRAKNSSSRSLLDTRHVQEIVGRRHLVTVTSSSSSSSSTRGQCHCFLGCCGGRGDHLNKHYDQEEQRAAATAALVEIWYDVRCRDVNGIEHVIVDKLSRLEEALYLEQEIETFLGLVSIADNNDNDDNV